MEVTQSGDLFESFLLDSWDALGQFEAAVFSLQDAFTEEALTQLAVLSHRIKGTCALYGFPQMSRLAALAERLLEFRPELDAEGRAGLIAFFERLTVCLRGALEHLSNGQGEGELGLQFTEIGGTAMLTRLLQQHAQAFAPRAAGQKNSQAAGQDINAQLVQFKRENADVWDYFAPEIREHVEMMRAILDSSDGSEEALTSLFRSAHTLKGSSFMVGFTHLGDLGHLLEDVMSAVREGQLQLDASVTLVLGEGVDLAERMLRAAEGEPGELTRVLRHTRRKLHGLLGQDVEATEATPVEVAPAAPATPAPAPEARATVRVPVEKLDALMNEVSELVVARGRLTYQITQLNDLARLLAAAQERMMRTAQEFEQKYLNPHLTKAEAVDSAPAQSGSNSVTSTVQELFDELEFDSYNDLNIVARSVTEISADLAELHGQLETQLAELHDEGEAVAKLARSLRGEVARARRVPFGQAVTRLKRWARTRDGAKPFTLDFSGDTVEVDTFVLEAVVDPLLHLLNNALIHGIEAPAVRAQRGKPAEGRIRVQAAQHGPYLEIEVQDDGGGIDVNAVRERARQRVPGEELARMSDDEVRALIFLPGLSTAREVTSDAGRGVGMDVVASNLRRLGGEVLVQSTPGQGSFFTLRVPLTQQITETLVLRVGQHVAGFPTTLVRALRSIPRQDTLKSSDGETVTVEGEQIPLYHLSELWGYAPESVNELQVVVVQSGAKRIAVSVGEFIGLEELAVRPVGGLLEHVAYLSGMTLSSSGDVVLMLDPAGIERLRDAGAAVRSTLPSVVTRARQKRLLLIDDSVSVRRVVAKMLERAGYAVVTAPDGYEALELLRADTDFDAILTDLEMPRVSGYEVIEEVRRRTVIAHLPVIVMTTRAGEKHQNLALTLGATEYFSKPIDESRLTRRLSELTGGVRLRA